MEKVEMTTDKIVSSVVMHGDFNEIIKSHEKLGGRLRPHQQMQDFRDVLDECGFVDLGFVGNKFTWYKNFSNGHTIWERLDRAIGTQSWFSIFLATKVVTLECGTSDHKPIIIHPMGIPDRKNRPWRFEQVWLEDEGCHEIAHLAWRSDGGTSLMDKVTGKIKRCQSSFKWWSKKSFGNVTRQLIEKKKMLKQAESVAVQGGNVETGHQLKHEIQRLLLVEEKLWQQRSKSHWIKSGDKNTSFFHNRASQRYRRNTIHGLLNARGEMCCGDKKVAELMVEYYTDLFTSSQPSEIDMVLHHIPRKVIDGMNAFLGRDFNKEEVDMALSQMAPLKAPRPDGLPPIFFQHYWGEIGGDVAEAVCSCLNSGHIPAKINHTYITLVPKVKSPDQVSQFRPIALCNILYKLISKVLANRLKVILLDIIFESQSAFQSDKAISNNILVAYETLHHMKTKNSGKLGFMTLKLDMSKAYDRVEWVFLLKLMEKMGFDSKWIMMISECINTVSYSILHTY